MSGADGPGRHHDRADGPGPQADPTAARGERPEGPGWDGDHPEVRDGPPWVMTEMVAVQPALAAPILGDPAVRAVADLVRGAVDAGAPVVVTGCGTSEHAALGIAALLEESLREGGARAGTVESREAFEASLDPRPGGVLIGVSHEGGTAATVAALAAAGAAGATTVTVTAKPDAAAAGESDLVVATPLVDASWCHTVGYTSPLLVGAAVAAALRGAAEDPVAVEARLRALAALEAPAAALARALHGVRLLIVVGSGLDLVTARELAIKVEEAVHLPAAVRLLETFLHGHLPACDETTGLVLVSTDPHGARERASRGATLLRAAARVGMRTAAVVSGETDEHLGEAPTSAGRLLLPAEPALTRALGPLLDGALALQHLTLGLVGAAGTNPDLIRREQRPWREAAAIASTASIDG